MKSEQQYIALYQEFRESIHTHSAPLLNDLREDAFSVFSRRGFPSKKQERYKYTDVNKAFSPNYGLNLNRLHFPVNPYDAFRCDVPNLSTSLYFIINDSFYTDALPKAQLPEGVVVDSLSHAATTFPEIVRKYYAQLADSEKDGITALNTMFCQDGLFVYIPHGVVVSRPIQVVNILRSDVDLMVNRRVLVILEDGSQAKLLFCDHAMDDRNFLATQVSEIYVGKHADLQLYELEETHIRSNRFCNMHVHQSAHSTVTLGNITLHNGITRNKTDIVLEGEHAQTNLFGCITIDKEQHVDNNTLVDHKAPYCTSNELYKYVLDGHSTGAFAGRVLVREGAEKTISQETNANLCTTKEARMYTQPMLEIYADDVKCSHGSSVGQLGDAALFYMRQRGIPLEEARLLLKAAFVGQVIDVIPMEALRDRLRYLIDKRFRGELSKCEGCKLCK